MERWVILLVFVGYVGIVMAPVPRWRHLLMVFGASGCGLGVFAGGVSFAHWDPCHSEQYFVDLHAQLIALAGLGFMFSSGALLIISGRLEFLERELKRSGALLADGDGVQG